MKLSRYLIFCLFSNMAFSMVIDLPKFKKPNEKKEEYFIIQNLGTEYLRVYKKASCRKCNHKLILETKMVIGENSPGYRSILGAFKISSWHKFYTDNKKRYPSWFDPEYEDLPKPNAPVEEWMMKRGSFGWFTAKLIPNAHAQWMHGTRGWGADKQKYIFPLVDKKGELIKWESSGCSRLDNETIAFIHSFVPVGSDVIKIYSKEEVKNKKSIDEQYNQWRYYLTANEIRKKSPQTIDARYISNQRINSLDIIEKGTLIYKSFPSSQDFLNNYKLKGFKGKFYPDIGMLEDYRHPKKIKISGNSIPDYIQLK